MSTLSGAYVAGLIDGEGCIYLTPDRRAARAAKRSYNLTVEVGMTRPARAVLERLKHQWGGSLNKTRNATTRWAEAWAWRVNGRAAAALLDDIAPYLTVKKEQASLALLAHGIRASLVPPGKTYAKWTPEASAQVGEIRTRLRELNKKGPDVPLEREPIALLVDGQWVTPQRDLFGSLSSEPFSGPWPNSGMGARGVCWTCNTSEFPKDAVGSSLSDVLEPEVDPKYFLSPKACRGILRRARKRGKQLPPSLGRALEQRAQEGRRRNSTSTCSTTRRAEAGA